MAGPRMMNGPWVVATARAVVDFIRRVPQGVLEPLCDPAHSRVGFPTRGSGSACGKEAATASRIVRGNAVAIAAGVAVAVFAATAQVPAAAAGWSTVPSPSHQEPAASYIFSASCTAHDFCVAAGSYITANNAGGRFQSMVELWDGTAWEATLPAVDPTNANELLGVSCVSTTWCVAVGYVGNNTLIEHWDGVSWSRQTSPTVSTGANELAAVSCVSTKFCAAVGTYADGNGASHALAESWNGSSWTQSTADDSVNHLQGVSCVAASSCTAVGRGDSSTNLIETWDGASWSVAPSPHTRTADFLSGVSCTSVSSCMAVGSSVGPGGFDQATLTMSWDGAGWTIVPSPGVSNVENGLSSVSCYAASNCVAAGNDYDGGSQFRGTLVEVWDGTGWSIAPSQDPGPTFNFLMSVSCAADGFCISAGYFSDPTAGAGTLVESPSGSSWTVVATPDALIQEINVLTAVSCTSAWACDAVGFYEDDTLGNLHALIETWNGSGWVIVNVSDEPGHDRTLKGISCIGTGFCAAVGMDESTPGTPATDVTFIEMESGATWSVVPSPNGGSAGNLLSGVSCTSTTSCTAVGRYVNASGVAQTLVEAWDGTTWSIVPSPSPDAGGDNLFSVACTTTAACVAVGSVDEIWNGVAWTVISGPAGLGSVACPATNRCLGVGATTGASGGAQPVAAAWNGSTWSDAATATISPGNTNLASVSCSSVTTCTAVGAYAAGSIYEDTAVETWNGTSWSQQASPSPGSGPGAVDELLGVSCVTGAPCMAVGVQNDQGWGQTLVEASGPTPPPPPPVPPAVSSLSPSSGSSLGGVPVTITGSGFTGATSVDFGSVPAESFTVLSDTSLQVFSPMVSAGTVDVTVTTPNGRSSACGCSSDQFVASAPSFPTQDVVSTKQFALTDSDGSTWEPLACSGGATTCSSAGSGEALRATLTPSSAGFALLTANADLWTQNTGYNQDIGLFVNGSLVAWKESGGFAGTFSPNAATLQTEYPVVAGQSYAIDVRWKANIRATNGATIQAGAGPWDGQFSPTRLTAVLLPGSAVPAAVSSTHQYALSGSDGVTWVPMTCGSGPTACTTGSGNLATTITPSSDGVALLGFNADLWTDTAGYNQDVAIFINGAMAGWKESGGYAGTFSPNAAMLQVRYPVQAGHSYSVDVRWRANKADGGTIEAAAGSAGAFSPSILTTELLPAGSNPFSATSTRQFSLSNSDGSTWQPMACGAGATTCSSGGSGDAMSLTVTPHQNCLVVLSGNTDLWTDTAGFNQDIGIFVNGTLAGWKESGGFAGTLSPNAALVQVTQTFTAGTTYTVDIRWKTNQASGARIAAGAGPAAPFSPTSLLADFISCS